MGAGGFVGEDKFLSRIRSHKNLQSVTLEEKVYCISPICKKPIKDGIKVLKVNYDLFALKDGLVSLEGRTGYLHLKCYNFLSEASELGAGLTTYWPEATVRIHYKKK